MEQLINKLREILKYLEDPSTGHHTGDKSICYLTYPFDMVLEMKKNLDTMISLIKHYSYDCEVLSLGNLIHDFLRNNPRRKNWTGYAQVEDNFEMNEFFKGLGNTVKTSEILEKTILKTQKELLGKPKPLLLLTDIEGIHPFTRFGPIEQMIYNNIEIPIIIFYPGELYGESLKFLGFYPPDGNYRSKHF